eukprot:jgi/Tetstr1/434747/TSEL_023799.t1
MLARFEDAGVEFTPSTWAVAYADHVARCSGGGSNHAAHEWAAHGLSDICHDVKSALGVGVQILTDPSVLVSLPKGSDGRPADVGLFGYGGIRGNTVAVDTTIAPILGVSTSDPTTALRAAERHKIQKYDEGVRNAAGMLRFVPFAVSEFGSLAPHAEAFLGAPLATTSFCVAIHPEAHQCDSTLEVTDGAARFNAGDGFVVGLPEHVWPALDAFRTSIKASVGLEVRFDKMHAYIADIKAVRREAPADIEWPELDGHHGISVLNVPLGSPECVQAYMRGKAEELREEGDASLSKLLSAKPSRGVFAEAVDATVRAAVERVLGVSFDPSTYGTDTNPVVTGFLAELLHDPDPMETEAATLSEDAVSWARNMLHLPSRLKGAGIRRMATVRDAAFIGCMNDIFPRFLTCWNSGTNTPTPGFFDPQLGSVLGRGSFNTTSSARRYDHFLNDAHGSDSYAAAMREAWGRLQAATAGHLSDAYASSDGANSSAIPLPKLHSTSEDHPRHTHVHV